MRKFEELQLGGEKLANHGFVTDIQPIKFFALGSFLVIKVYNFPAEGEEIRYPMTPRISKLS